MLRFFGQGLGLLLALTLTQCVRSDDDLSSDASSSTGGETSGAGGDTSQGAGGATASGGQNANITGGGPGAGGASGGESGEDCVVDLECEPPLLPSSGDFAQDCVDRINQFRVGCSCLPPLERWAQGEACADANAIYDQGTGMAHSGWRGEACDEESGPLSEEMNGWATNECPGPYYDSPEDVLRACLPAMYAEGASWSDRLGHAPTEDDLEACSGACYSENGHFIAMTKPSHARVACGITPSGELWSVQNFE